MKQILLICIIILSHSLWAELNVNTNYLNVNHYNTLESSVNWDKHWNDSWQLNYQYLFSNSSNDYFDRNNKNSNINWSLIHEDKLLPFQIDYVYAYNLNKGLPEDTVSVIDNQKQTLSFGFEKHIFEIFTLSQFIGKSKIETSDRNFLGNVYRGKLNFYKTGGAYILDNSFDYFNNTTFLDKDKHYATNLRFAYNNEAHIFDANVKLFNAYQDVYTYQKKTDDQSKLDYYDNLVIQYPFMEMLIWNFKQNGNFRKNIYSDNKNKNNWTFDNYLDSYFKYSNDSFLIKIGTKHNYKKRYLKVDNQNRKSIDRSIYNTIQFTNVIFDTLSIDTSVLLTQNFHSYPYNSLDNDRQLQIISLILQENLNNVVYLKNLVTFQRSHEVYINSSLSSNNNRKSTYIIQPEIISQMLENFQIYNKYHIRATYENYIWNEYIKDRFYRRINAEWGFAINGDEHLNMSKIQISYAYESNESADYSSSEWYVNSKNIIRTISARFRVNQEKLSYRIEPQLKYQYKKYETEMLFNLNWNFKSDSNFRLTINPIGNNFNQLIWKVNAGLEFNY